MLKFASGISSRAGNGGGGGVWDGRLRLERTRVEGNG